MTTTLVPVRLDRLAAMFPHQVARTSELYRLGVPGKLVSSWREALPGVVLLTGNRPTRAGFLRAALRYAEPNAVITGYDALQLHGIPIPGLDGTVHLLVPFANPRLTPVRSLHVDRLRVLPKWTMSRGFPVASVARATLDAARRTRGPTELATLLRLACAQGGVSTAELLTELDESPQRGRPAVREALNKLPLNVVDIQQARAQRILALAELPRPTWDRRITSDGRQLLGTANAWWNEVGLAWLWLKNRRPDGPDPLANAGVHVVRTPVEQLAEAPDTVAEELRMAYSLARLSPRPGVIAS
ncbi:MULTISPECIES: hypothetical protein [unclassified Crossiella]|uniref:hypothetical protein n=1 Tax=unclassified Crossiella TaxID=2620835 RepID=UPI001FFEAC5C|nr:MULTISPECIES: hypothetical protein [unclassified Crossiella]MCK2241025.1 hypothetical protein [Crossiella sp. S99.2]MCK2253831.1 hypothetical protein [Crossiella sp. S99.1]